MRVIVLRSPEGHLLWVTETEGEAAERYADLYAGQGGGRAVRRFRVEREDNLPRFRLVPL